jgi:tetratricopeptide (TPR) repeat protein
MGYYAALGRYEDAKRIYEAAKKRNLSYRHIPVYYYAIAFLQHDQAGMAQALEEANRKQAGDDEIVVEQALVEAYLGRRRKAHDFFQQAINAAKRKNDEVSVRRLYGTRAHVAAMMGAHAAARADAKLALASALERDALSLAGWALARTGDVAAAQAAELELSRRFPFNTIAGVYAATLRATLANQAGEAENAIEMLKPGARYDLATAGGTMAMYPVFVRGESYLRAGDGRQAAAEFQKILDHPGIVSNSPVGSLARLWSARALALAGEMTQSRKAFEEFFQLWKDADADVPVLIEARRQLRELSR